jgi:MFS family permease
LPVVIVARFISGFLSAMPTVAAASSIENMWDSRARIWVVHLWISGAIIGISVAPALTTLVRESHLKWFGYSPTILTVLPR